jgi:hypothetical protein
MDAEKTMDEAVLRGTIAALKTTGSKCTSLVTGIMASPPVHDGREARIGESSLDSYRVDVPLPQANEVLTQLEEIEKKRGWVRFSESAR